MTEEDDDALISAAGRGDERAFNRLVARHAPRIHAAARRILASDADAEDVVQEVFWRAWRQAPGWRTGEARFSTWLYRVATNLCIDRTRRRRHVTPADDIDIADDTPDGTAALGARQELTAMQRAIAALPEKQRMAIVLSVQQDLPNREIAAVMGISEGAAEQLLVRARRTLREAYRAMT